MEKSIDIIIPEGYEIDKQKSTFEKIIFKKKCMTYHDVTTEMFKDKTVYWNHPCMPITSKKHIQKIHAMNQLMNVAKYLNGDWNSENSPKWYIVIKDDTITYFATDMFNVSFVYFKSEELAKEAVEILGEDKIRLALCNDW